MKTDTRQRLRSSEDPHELVGKAVWLDRTAVQLRKHVRLIRKPDPDFEKLFGLFGAMAAKFIHHQRGEGDCAVPAALSLLLPNAPTRLLRARDHRELRTVQIKGAPLQRGDLAATQSAERPQQHGDEHSGGAEM